MVMAVCHMYKPRNHSHSLYKATSLTSVILVVPCYYRGSSYITVRIRCNTSHIAQQMLTIILRLFYLYGDVGSFHFSTKLILKVWIYHRWSCKLLLKEDNIQKDTYSHIYNSQSMKAVWMSTDRGMDKEGVVHMYNGILLSHEKEWNNAICSHMDEAGDYHTIWSKSGKDKYHRILFTCGI